MPHCVHIIRNMKQHTRHTHKLTNTWTNIHTHKERGLAPNTESPSSLRGLVSTQCGFLSQSQLQIMNSWRKNNIKMLWEENILYFNRRKVLEQCTHSLPPYLSKPVPNKQTHFQEVRVLTLRLMQEMLICLISSISKSKVLGEDKPVKVNKN